MAFTRQLIAQIQQLLRRGQIGSDYAAVLKWDQNQPRGPKGSPEGGRWVKGGGRSEALTTSHAPALGMSKTRGGAAYSDILAAVGQTIGPMGTGFKNRPRMVGAPVQAPQPAPTGSAALQTGSVTDATEIGGGHVNKAYRVRLDNGATAVIKPEQGERMGDPDSPGFSNKDIDRTVINKDLPLGEREAMAAEFSEAAKLDLVPVTVFRSDLGGIPHNPYPNNPDGNPEGAMVQDFVPGLRGQGSGTPEEVRRLAVFDYAVGSMDRHSENVFNDGNGKLLAMDNGYSFPDPTSPGVDSPRAGDSSSGGPGTNTLQGMYDEYREEAENDVRGVVEDKMDQRWDDHVEGVKAAAEDVQKIWDEAVKEHQATIDARVAGQEHDVLPMGSKTPFERQVVALEMEDIFKEANIDLRGGLVQDEREDVGVLFRQKIAEGATELVPFDEQEYRDAHRDSWMADHASMADRMRAEQVQSFNQWRSDQGYNPSLGSSGGFTLITGEPDGFQFRSAPVRDARFSDDLLMPEAERAPIRAALESTDWKAFCDRHPNMTVGERDAFLGRIDRLKEALKTEEGLRKLWEKQKLQSH